MYNSRDEAFDCIFLNLCIWNWIVSANLCNLSGLCIYEDNKREKASIKVGTFFFPHHITFLWKWRKIVLFCSIIKHNFLWWIGLMRLECFREQLNLQMKMLFSFKVLKIFSKMTIYWKAFIFLENICLIKSFSLEKGFVETFLTSYNHAQGFYCHRVLDT